MKFLKLVLAVPVLAATFGGGYVLRAVKHPAGTASGTRRVLYYVDPMHPQYKSDRPGIAPDCGMQLVPVYTDQYGNPIATDGRESREGPAPPAGAIHISPERQQTIGVTYAVVEPGGASRSIRAVGKVAVDETRVGHVHTRIDGWIEKVFIDFTGAVVTKDQAMLTIYSPEMLASEEELLLAARAKDVMPSLVDAARRRLELWQLSEDQITQVLESGQPIRSITVHAPMSGYVTERNAFPNQKVTPDSDLYTITDLNRVWIVADVFESDATAVKVGDETHVQFANGNAPAIMAKVSYIQPQVDPITRTLKVRLDAANPGMRMKPEMFVNVEFGVASSPQLTIPADAVLDTGEHQTVFVNLGNGYLEPRTVTVGERFGDRVTVLHGLAAGEHVVASGTFLIDSESQLQSAARGMGAPPADHLHATSPPPSPHVGHGRD
jgi:hypothetical protein